MRIERVLLRLSPPPVISLLADQAGTLLLSSALQACRAEVSLGIHADCEEKIKAEGPGASCSSAEMQFPSRRQGPAQARKGEAQPLIDPAGPARKEEVRAKPRA